MKRISEISELRQCLAEERKKANNSSGGEHRRGQSGEWKVGLVPTMGYLHEGHVSLVKQAKRECDLVVMSIFVNPLQFAPGEDFESYPRDLERDGAIAEACGVDLLFHPAVEEMYPKSRTTFVNVPEEITKVLEGVTRPTHFDGVTTVVCKLFQIVQPDIAYFGQKDAQQVVVIRNMVEDLNIPVNIAVCPIVREPDGVAMSSRNTYLTPEERISARCLSLAIEGAVRRVESFDEREESASARQGDTAASLLEEMSKEISATKYARIDYIKIVSPEDLREYSPQTSFSVLKKMGYLLLVAVYIGNTRLIDNHLRFGDAPSVQAHGLPGEAQSEENL